MKRKPGMLFERIKPAPSDRLTRFYEVGPMRLNAQSLKTVKARISADNLRYNAFQFKKLLGYNSRLCVVVKANAYGHDARLTVSSLGSDITDYFMVSTIEEAEQIQHLTAGRRVLVTCPLYEGVDRELIKLALARQFQCSICSYDALNYIADTLKDGFDADAPQRLKIHLKVDTGMTRLGCSASDAALLAEAIDENAYVKLAGIYSHMATADDDLDFASEQLMLYRKVLEDTSEWTNYRSVIKHFSNTSGAVALPAGRFDMARCGIGIYGYTNLPKEVEGELDLRPALKVVAPLVHIKHIPAGRKIGYGCSYTSQKDMTIGVIPVGYADGFFRAFSNNAVLRCNGVDVPVVGRVSMDLTILDLSNVPNLQEAMEVTVIDDDKSSPCSVANLAKIADTVPYEILIAIGNRVKRELV